MLSRVTRRRKRRPCPWADGVALLVLSAGAWFVGRAYLTADLFIWGDNPGQFMRLWYPLTVSWPRFRQVVDWNPLWYAGYPELQFYPPGFVLVGMGIHLMTLGRLHPFGVYNALLFVALVLPAFTVYAFLRGLLARLGQWPAASAGAVAGLLALGFAPQWGGTNAVSIGLVGERLAFGVVPLVWLAGLALVEGPSVTRLAVAAGLLALLTLLHPFHVPAALLWVGVYALARARGRDAKSRRDKSSPALWIGLWVLLALGLTAWWLVPLWARRAYAAPLVRATLDETLRWLRADQVPLLAGAALPTVGLLRGRSTWSPPGAGTAALWGTLAALGSGILLNHLILVERLGIFLFDPVRFTAEYYLSLIVLAGLAVGVVVHRGGRPTWAPLAAGLLVLSLNGAALFQMWPTVRAKAHPAPQTALSTAMTHPAFAGLWDVLRRGPEADGRVLFTSYYTTLTWPDGTATPTAIKAMTPFFTGREIVGGTFSHWSPVARLLWVGDPWATVLPERVEQEDGRTLLGRPWPELDPAELYAAVRALNVTTIVADADDVQARQVLDASPRFQSYWNNGFFYLYRPLPLMPAWADGEGIAVTEVERSPHRWRLRVRGEGATGWVRVKMTAYPLWDARVDGRRVPLQADRYALVRVALPPGASEVTLTYRPGLPERAGQAVSALSVAALFVAWAWSRRRGTFSSRLCPPTRR